MLVCDNPDMTTSFLCHILLDSLPVQLEALVGGTGAAENVRRCLSPGSMSNTHGTVSRERMTYQSRNTPTRLPTVTTIYFLPPRRTVGGSGGVITSFSWVRCQID